MYGDLCNCRKKLDGVLRKKLGNVGGKRPRSFVPRRSDMFRRKKEKRYKLSQFIMVRQCNNISR